MPSFTVTEVSDKVRSYDTDYGAKKAYRVHLRNGDGTDRTDHLNIEWRRNADSPAPTVGQQLEGDLVDQGQYGQRLQPAYGGGGSGGGSRPEDPLRQKRIVRQHSQTTALQTMDMLERWDLLGEDKPNDRGQFFELWKTVMDWLDADVDKAAR